MYIVTQSIPCELAEKIVNKSINKTALLENTIWILAHIGAAFVGYASVKVGHKIICKFKESKNGQNDELDIPEFVIVDQENR